MDELMDRVDAGKIAGIAGKSKDSSEAPTPIGTLMNLPRDCRKLQRVLNTYKIAAQVQESADGPSSHQYYLSLIGARIADIERHKPEIALALGKQEHDILVTTDGGRVVLSVNKALSKRAAASFAALAAAPKFAAGKYLIPVGMDNAGNPVMSDFTAFPHLLVAGASGSGKTVFLQSMIAGLAMKCSPEDLELMLIDGNYQDLQYFDGLPHMVTDGVLCETEEIIGGLQAAVDEMDRRMTARRSDGRAAFPHLLVVVDEVDKLLSDKATRQQVEPLLTRISKEGRKFGIHIAIGSQRPSGDLISPHILANISTRVCLKVSKESYSENVIGSGEAASLGGAGDLLFLHDGGLTRVQGYMIKPEEIERIVEMAAAKHSPAPRLESASMDLKDNSAASPDVIDLASYQSRESLPQAVNSALFTPPSLEASPKVSPEAPQKEAKTLLETPTNTIESESLESQIITLNGKGWTERHIADELGTNQTKVHRTIAKSRAHANG
jgi:S-DNA-T family DNA segregation ATPase FtsK/SpoIIIE